MNPRHVVLDKLGQNYGHVLNDSMLPTTSFSLRVELVSRQSCWWAWLNVIESGGLELATSACTCGSVDQF